VKYGFFEVVETGWPKMDPLFRNSPESLHKNERPVVLFTSTFTRRLSAAPILFETIARLSKKGKWNWLINFHPKMDRAVVAQYRSIQNENLKFVATDDIIPLLKTADIMVSDTSSVVSEFLLLYKPVVTLNNQKPGPHLMNISNSAELEHAIERGLTFPADLMNEIRKYADGIHPYRDGCSSRRVLTATDRLVQKGTAHLKQKPWNLIRRLKLRWTLGYYRFR
jgi:CDP-glycerol glycerophosphotransferase (TagB/SpsB family)